MKTKNEVIGFIQSELESSNTIIISTLGNGGSGLTYVQTQDEEKIENFMSELQDCEFEGVVPGEEDITECEYYTADCCEVYQFNGENGFYTQVMTF